MNFERLDSSDLKGIDMHNILIAISAAFIVAPCFASMAVTPNHSDDHANAALHPLHIVDKTLVA